MVSLVKTPPATPSGKTTGSTRPVTDTNHGVITPPHSPKSASKASKSHGLPASRKFCLHDETSILEQTVGTGQWSSVSKAAVGDMIVAIKRPRGKQARKILEREAQILSMLTADDGSQDFVVPFHGIDPNESSLVLDFMPTSLETLSQSRKFADARNDLVSLTQHLVRGLVFLQEHNVIHGDIKPGNILVDDDYPVGRAVYCDFSASRLDDPLMPETESAGTYDFMAPELFDWRNSDSTATFASDVFALAMTIISIAIGHSPYENYTSSYMKVTVAKQAQPLELIRNGPDAGLAERAGLAELVGGALHANPGDRWTAAAWLEHLSHV